MNNGVLTYPEGGSKPDFLFRWERTAAGNYQWLCPEGISRVRVTCVGGGAGGGAGAGGGGGAGGGAGGLAIAIVPVTPGKIYTVVVGAKGVGQGNDTGTSGGDSTFDGTSVIGRGGLFGGRASAPPPPYGVHGTGGDGVGDSTWRGGDGTDGTAGLGGNGGSGPFGIGGTGGAGTPGANGNGAGAGGAGARGAPSVGGDGTDGFVVIEF